MAAGADEDQVVLMNYAEKMPHLDFVNLMLYDMSRGFDISRHQSPLRSSTSDPYAWPRERYNVDHVVSLMKAEAGGGGSGSADGRKFVIGIPLYGYRTTVEAGADTTGSLPGLFKSQSCGRDCQTPVAYADIAGGALGPDFRRHFDPEAQVPYLYDPAIGGFVTYDDVESVTAKAAYVNDNRLGGVMFWALDMDTTDNSTSLVQTAFRKMDEVESSPISLNTWCSSATPFCNVRCPRFHNRPLYAYAQ